MEFIYTCCNKKTLFKGTKESFDNKVRQNRKCLSCSKIKNTIENTYFKLDKNGRNRRLIDFDCNDCNKKITSRYDSYKKCMYKNLCLSCLSKKQPSSFQKTQKGLSKHPIYKSWSCMNRRCYYEKNDNYKWYGAKGISICDEWKNDFLKFFEWSIKNNWKEGLEIDRINNNGNYEPSNCRWITHKENCKNR